MKFGIREKVALIVIIAAAVSAYLVATILSKKAAEMLREHELVDLGDEASLRGWVITDRVAGLGEDVGNLGFSEDLQALLVESPDDEEALQLLARRLSTRYFNHHLRIDVVPFLGVKQLAPKVIEEKAVVDPSDLWFPDIETSKDLENLARERLRFSPIQRKRVVRKEFAGEENVERFEPVIWAIAPLGTTMAVPPEELDPNVEPAADTRRFVRIMMTLENSQSPRHLVAMLNSDRSELLTRPDETAGPENPNDKVFMDLARDPQIEDYFIKLKAANILNTVSEKSEDSVRVERFLMRERHRLAQPFYFMEGRPHDKFGRELDSINDDQERKKEFNEFMGDLRDDVFFNGRIGGLRNAVSAIRLLSPSKDQLEVVQKTVDRELEEKFGEKFDGLDWWGKPVVCDEINVWAVRVSVGTADAPNHYLMLYSVLEDELTSSIQHEMRTLRWVAFLLAAGAGIVAFLLSILLIRPLQQMTDTSNRVIEAEPEDFHENLAALSRELPTGRRDEVGDIARASKRVFEEVVSFHSQLEQRVLARTSELHKANFELEEAYEKLMSLNREKDAFVAKVSHDLRQPLTVIFLQIEELLFSDLSDSQKDGLEKIRAQAKRELDLVNDILDYQKIIMGADPLVKEEIDVCGLLGELEEAHRRAAEGKEIVFKKDCADDIGLINADRKRLHQVLNNLVGNAVKFTKEGGVEVAAFAREIVGEKWIEFSINDSGRGMSPEEQAQAFTPFVSTKKDNPTGNGLGLSIAKELVEQMGGNIGFVSELGKGTRFTVMLPREATSDGYDPEKSKINPMEKRHHPIVQKKKQKDKKPDCDTPEPIEDVEDVARSLPVASGSSILVIDDDAAVRELLRRLLEAEGYVVYTAETGEEGLKIAREKKPDAITLDVVMPGKDGWQVLAELKMDDETESIPVIMVSIMAKNAQGLALGVEDFLVKPIDTSRLSKVIRRATSQTPQRNILIVDDDQDSREAFGRLLNEQGWQTTLAGDGTEAIEVLRKTRPAAILLDLHMAGMDGFEFLARVSDDEGLKSIPVIVVTGKNPTADESEFLLEHVENIIQKGDTTAEEVLQTIASRVRQRPGSPA
ncbi:MAG: response regulator [Verrucomicrobiales bacterium]|nr:response regulator [Verrucomicrobiales bacterium]